MKNRVELKSLLPNFVQVDNEQPSQDFEYQEIEIITAPTVRSRANNGHSTFEVKVAAGFHTTKT